MKTEYLDRFGMEIQAFVKDIERQSGIEIDVETDKNRIGRHIGEADPLACIVTESEARILVPSTTELSDGAVLHELHHIHRFLVEKIPQIAVCEDHWSPELERFFAQLDNNLEHLVIVPIEIQQIPERRSRWIAKLQRVLSQIQDGLIPNTDQRFFAIYARFFVDYVLRDSALIEWSKSIIDNLGLSSDADIFRREMLSALPSKENAVRVGVDLFNIDPSFVCLDYLNSKEHLCEQKSL